MENMDNVIIPDLFGDVPTTTGLVTKYSDLNRYYVHPDNYHRMIAEVRAQGGVDAWGKVMPDKSHEFDLGRDTDTWLGRTEEIEGAVSSNRVEVMRKLNEMIGTAAERENFGDLVKRYIEDKDIDEIARSKALADRSRRLYEEQNGDESEDQPKGNKQKRTPKQSAKVSINSSEGSDDSRYAVIDSDDEDQISNFESWFAEMDDMIEQRLAASEAVVSPSIPYFNVDSVKAGVRSTTHDGLSTRSSNTAGVASISAPASSISQTAHFSGGSNTGEKSSLFSNENHNEVAASGDREVYSRNVQENLPLFLSMKTRLKMISEGLAEKYAKVKYVRRYPECKNVNYFKNK